MKEYEELRIRIWKTGIHRRYLVFANGPASAAAAVTLSPRIGGRGQLRQLFRQSEAAAREAGRELFATFFPEPLYEALATSLRIAKQDGKGLRLRFEVEAELMDLPLELLCSPADDPLGGYLALHPDLSIARSLPGAAHNPLRLPQAEDERGNVILLVVASSPERLPRLQVEREITGIDANLPRLLDGLGKNPLQVLGGARGRATRRNVGAFLRNQHAPCALVLIAHGGFEGEQNQNPVVMLEQEDGSVDPVSGDVLRGLLCQAPGLRLVLLNLCLGAKAPKGEPFSGLAAGLIAGGIPAVVAMQWEVSDTAAAVCSPAIFNAIYENHTIDQAVSNARREMNNHQVPHLEWANPVLLLHRDCGHGWLFKVQEIRDEGEELPDPLRDCQTVLAKIQRKPTVASVSQAAHCLKPRREWKQILNLAKAGLAKKHDHPVCARLVQEAKVETRLEDLRDVCRTLAGPAEVTKVDETLKQLRDALPAQAHAVLAQELAAARDLDEAYRQAVAAEKARRWAAAAKGYLRLFPSRRPAHRDVRERFRKVNRERRVENLCRQAEEGLDAGQWNSARQLFGRTLKLRPGCREAEQGRLYTEGRLAEDNSRPDWAVAARAYTRLKKYRDKYRDSPLRAAYTRGRVAEERARGRVGPRPGWKKAEDAYGRSGLVEAFPDIVWRLPYARARAAEEAEEWARAAAAFAELERDHHGRWSDASARCHHAQGRLAETAGDWQGALEAYARLTDAEHFQELQIPARKAYVEARREEEVGGWARPLALYAGPAADVAEARARRTRLEALVAALPWAEELVAAGWAADPVAAAAGKDPYALLAPAAVRPGASAEAVREASFVLMERGAMTPEARAAWDVLRTLPGRLRTEAFLYRLHDRVGLRRAMTQLEPGSREQVLAALAHELPWDAPLLLLLGGRRAEAVARWQERRQREPADAEVAHLLALASLFATRELAAAPEAEDAAATWEEALACWAMVLCDDAHWEARRREWEASWEQTVTAADLVQLRSELIQELLAELTEPACCAAPDRVAEATARSLQLTLSLEVELAGARALAAVGGLACENGSLVCGPLYLRRVSLGARLGRTLWQLESAGGREREDLPPRLESAPDISERAGEEGTTAPETLLRLRCSFSELGCAALLLDRNRYEEAIQALPALYRQRLGDLPGDCAAAAADDETALAAHCRGCPACQGFLEHNPAYLALPHRSARLLQDAVELATRARLGQARAALAAGERDGALHGWRQAIEVAANAGAQVRTKRAVVQVVLGRVEALAHERGRRRGARLSEAITLVEEARRLVGKVDEGLLEVRLAKLLTARGVWHGYGCLEYEDTDYEKAAADLRAALGLTPDSLHARDNLSRALIVHAANLAGEGASARVLRLFAEAFTVLHEGLERAAALRELGEWLGRGLDELEGILLSELDPEQLAERIAAVGRPRAGAGGAGTARARGGSGMADLMDLIAAVRRDPGDASRRRSLLDAVGRLADAAQAARR